MSGGLLDRDALVLEDLLQLAGLEHLALDVAAAGNPSKQPMIESRERDNVAVTKPLPETSLRSAPLIGTQSSRAPNTPAS